MKKALVLLVLLLLALSLGCAQAEISLPANLTVIEDQAFEGNAAFRGVIDVPGGVHTVGKYAFRNTRIFGLNLPSAVSSIGEGILKGVNATYVTVGSASPSLAEGAFNGAYVIAGKPGGSVENWAKQHKVPFYSTDSLRYHDGFAYAPGEGNSVILAFPTQPRSGSIDIPKSVDGMAVRGVSSTAFTKLTGAPEINLPDTVGALPDQQVVWPDATINFYPVVPDGIAYPPEVEQDPDRAHQVNMLPKFVTLVQGESVTPEMENPPVDNWRRICTWVSSDERVATVDEGGVITAVGPGSASITATVRIVSLNEAPLQGEPLPEQVYYGATAVDVVPATLGMDIREDTLGLTPGQTYYSAVSFTGIGDSLEPTATLNYTDSLGRTQDSAELPVVSCELLESGEILLRANTPGTATLTLNAAYMGQTVSDILEITVSEPEIELNFTSLMTYPGYEYNLRVTSALNEGATVAWSSRDPAVATVDENGHAVIGASAGSTVINCTVTDPDGATASASLPVAIREGFRWAEAENRTLNAGWAYFEDSADLQPDLSCDLWPHDESALTITAASSNERTLYFGYEVDRLVGYARYPGEAEVTYTATLNRPANADEIAPYTSLSRTFTATVVMPEGMEAILYDQQINMSVGEVYTVSYDQNAPAQIQRSWFYSTDESVFTVNLEGMLIGLRPGEAELVYGFESYGEICETRASVTVTSGEIQLEPSEVTLSVGESFTLVPRMDLPQGEVDSFSAEFFTDNEAIVRVDDKGMITAIDPGTTVITYRVCVREPVGDEMSDFLKFAHCTVRVVDPEAAITFDKAGEQPLQDGVLALYPHVETQLHAYDQSGNELSDVTWTLDDDFGGQCQITADGWMTLNVETPDKVWYNYARATAQIGGEEVSAILTVSSAAPPAYIDYCYVNHKMQVGETTSCTMALRSVGQQGLTVDEAWANGQIEIVSMDEDIVRVTEDGKLYAVAPGTAQMKVILKTKEGVACDVGYFNVMAGVDRPAPNEETTLAFEREYYFLLASEPHSTHRLDLVINQPELLDFNGINYSSSNPDIVEIDGDGNFWCTGEVGTATIYASIEDYIGKDDPLASATITVVEPELVATVTHADGGTETLVNGGDSSLAPGETVTLEIMGLPIGGGEGQIPTEALQIDYNENVLYKVEQSESGDRMVFTAVRVDGSDLNVDIYPNLDWWGPSYHFYFDVPNPSVEYRLGGDAFIPAAVGERITLWPDFDWREVKDVTSSDENVLRIVQDEDAPVAFEVIGEGRATVTAQCLLGDGETWVTASCEVFAVPDAWTLYDIENVPDTMAVGEAYDVGAVLYNIGTVLPDVTLTSSDPEILEVIQNEDYADWTLVPHNAGWVTLTLTASKEGGEPQSVSREIFVTAPDVLLLPSESRLATGASELLRLIVNASSPVDRVEWSDDGAGIVTLHTNGSAKTSAFVSVNEGASPDIRSLVTAKAFFEDGSYDYASCWVIPEGDAWVDVWLEPEIEMSVGESRYIDRNADSNVDNTRDSFVSSDESVVIVNANGELLAKGPGEATVTFTVECYGGATASAEAIVRVRDPQVSLNKSALTLSVGEGEYLTAACEQSPDSFNNVNFYSRNEGVANVDDLGLVTGMSAGQTTIVCSADIFDQHVELYCDVTVTDPAQKLRITSEGSPVTRMTVQPCQEIPLGVQADGSLTGDIQWRVSDEDAILVESDGLLKVSQNYGLDYTCHVSATATVDGQEQTAYCEIQIQAPQFAFRVYPSAYQVDVGKSARIWYAVIANDLSMEVYPEFISSDEGIATVMSSTDQSDKLEAAIVGVSEGNCSVQLNLRDAQGRLLASQEIPVRVSSEALTPMSEGVKIAFDRDTYFVYDSEGEYDVYMYTYVEGADELLSFGCELVYESSDEGVVEIYDDGNLHAVAPGEADVTAWFRGFEDGPRATAHVTVGKPEVQVTLGDRDGATRVCEPGEDGAYEVEAGSLVTLTLVNPSETTPLEHSEWNFDDNALIHLSSDERSITLCPRFECTTDVSLDLEIPTSEPFTHNVTLRVQNVPVFDNPYLRANPGEIVDLWPEFDWDDIQDVSTSDASIVEIVDHEEWPVCFTAVGLGKATVSARVHQRDGEWVDLSSTVEVVEKQLEILDLDSIPSAMVVDDWCGGQPNIDYSGFRWPEFDWEVSDESVIEVVREENIPPQLHALRPGIVTVTAVVTSDDMTRSMSKTIVVSQPLVSFESRYIELRPDIQCVLPLYVNIENAEIAEIRVHTTNETVATAELITLENGDPAVLVTGVSTDGGETRICADVVMADGSVYGAGTNCRVIANGEIGVDARGDEIHLSTEAWGDGPTRTEVWLRWVTNAFLPDDPNRTGTDTAQIEWRIDDESVARLDGFYTDEDGNCDPWNNAPVIVAVGEGDTELHARLTLYDKDGAFLTQTETSMPVHVSTPVATLQPEQEIYEMNVGEERYIEWGESIENACPVDRDYTYSDDDSIASFDIHGNLLAMKPGETDIHHQIVFEEGTTFTASAHVVVTGVEMAYAEDSYTVAVGETIKPNLTLNENGVTIDGSGYETWDPSIAAVLSDGTVYGVAPGTTVLHSWVDTPYGHQDAGCTVTVTGDAPVFTLDATSLSLFPEQTAQLTPVYTGEGALENVTWSSDAPHIVQVDGDGRITTGRVNDLARFSHVVITCEATANGQDLRASCLVSTKEPRLRICEHQFGEGAWVGLGIDEWYGIHERYVVTDPSLTVERSITVDDPDVAQYDAEEDAFHAVGQGNTFAHYTVSASNGESYTRDLFIRVDEDATSESVTPVYGVFIVPFQWNQHNLPIEWAPEYTGCYVECMSSDPSIVSFDEGPDSMEMYFHGVEGLVTIDMTFPENPELNTQTQVLVIDEENPCITLEAEDGSTVLTPGQTVQLVLKNSYGLDLSGEVRAIHNFYDFDGNAFRLTENGQLTVLATESMSDCQIRAEVEFGEDYRVPVTYNFSVDAESAPYAFLKQQDGASERYILAPGSGTYLQLFTNQTTDNGALQISSSNPEVATVQQDENGLLVIGESAGEANISVSLPDAGLTASYPITVIEPTELCMVMSTSAGSVVRVGDEFEAYTSHEDPLLEHSSNLDCTHSYESSDPSVLDTLRNLDGEDPSGRGWMTFRALKPGTVTITSNAYLVNYPEITDVDTMTITVIP